MKSSVRFQFSSVESKHGFRKDHNITTMTEICTIMTKVHYRLSNGAGSKKELSGCSLVPVHARCYGWRHVNVSYQVPC